MISRKVLWEPQDILHKLFLEGYPSLKANLFVRQEGHAFLVVRSLLERAGKWYQTVLQFSSSWLGFFE